MKLTSTLRTIAALFTLMALPAMALPAIAQQVSMGNGEKSSIQTEGMKVDGRSLTFTEVRLEEPGWLVLHPFEDGAPQGKIYVGARYLPAGTHQNVTIDVTTAPEPTKGTNFIVMLHSDVDRDETFDFVFVDDRNVADKAVFEGSTMIGHIVSVP